MTTPARPSDRQDDSENAASSKRRKITRACDSCKSRKRRCTGELPCAICVAQNISCTYLASYNRGRLPTPQISAVFNGNLPGARANDSSLVKEGSLYVGGRQPTLVSQQQPSVILDNDRDNVMVVDKENNHIMTVDPSVPQLNSSMLISRRPSVDTDDMINDQGQYLGPTSAQAFLQRAYNRLCSYGPRHQSEGILPSNVPIFTFGDTIPPQVDQEPQSCLPAMPCARSLIDRYFDFASPTYRVLHRQTVDLWYSNMCAGGESNRISPAKQAIIYMVFAAATTLTSSEFEPQDFTTSEKYFIAANEQLDAELGSPTLASVQSRFLIVQFLLSSKRPNKAWFLFGTTVQLIMALGLHRNSRNRAPNDSIDTECGRRVFWGAYILDKYLSIMLGRPQLLHIEDVDQEFPAAINDEDLASPGITSKVRIRGDCLITALIFHAKLAVIVAKASREQYTIQRLAGRERVNKAIMKSSEIEAWQAMLPPVLSGAVHVSSLIGVFQRQMTVLRLARCHAMMLVNRPLLIRNYVKNHPGEDVVDQLEEYSQSVEKCVFAAEEVIDLVLWLVQDEQFYTAFWYSQYIAFNAISILYIYSLQLRKGNLSRISRAGKENHEDADSLWGELTEQAYLEKIALAHRHLASATAKSAPNLRYGVVLEELKREVLREIDLPRASGHTRSQARSDVMPHTGGLSTGGLPHAAQDIWSRSSDRNASSGTLAPAYEIDGFHDSTLGSLDGESTLMEDVQFWSHLDSLPLCKSKSAGCLTTL